ncbi:MAG: hypothetical protein Q7S65_06330 [Nanoarchaeota archaeon]|nr:hypothetical protein [Nanoarchaeota archaeon]
MESKMFEEPKWFRMVKEEALRQRKKIGEHQQELVPEEAVL